MNHSLFTIKLPLLFIITLFFSNANIQAQGCVAIRGFSGCTGNVGGGAMLAKGDLLLGTNFRYFQSFRHFRGDHEETHRVEEGTQVIK